MFFQLYNPESSGAIAHAPFGRRTVNHAGIARIISASFCRDDSQRAPQSPLSNGAIQARFVIEEPIHWRAAGAPMEKRAPGTRSHGAITDLN
jgi:hypothetical protein